MKTERLIGLLASGAGPAPRAPVARRLAPALAAALAASIVASVAVLGLIPPALWFGAARWIKLGYAAALGASCAWFLARLACPAAPIGASAAVTVALKVIS